MTAKDMLDEAHQALLTTVAGVADGDWELTALLRYLGRDPSWAG